MFCGIIKWLLTNESKGVTMSVIDSFLNRQDEIEIKKLNKIVDQIEALESEIQTLSDLDLSNKTKEFRDRLDKGETLDDLLVEAFAVAREATKRVLGMRQYRVQLIGGIVLHQGKIAEMKTGEGKTLVAVAPCYLNALSSKGVHVITVNDYLADRDADTVRPVFEFLGMTVGTIIAGQTPNIRQEKYRCDVSYGTNSEFGFDYLRDNMVKDLRQKVQRELNYCIIDEVDSILIDEARTPLIISGPGQKSTDNYYVMAKLVPQLKLGEDYTIDEKQKTVAPTEAGVAKMEKLLKVDNLYDTANLELKIQFQVSRII